LQIRNLNCLIKFHCRFNFLAENPKDNFDIDFIKIDAKAPNPTLSEE